MITSYRPTELSQHDVDVLNELILSKRLFGISKNNQTSKIQFVQASPEPIGTSFSCALRIADQRVDLVLEATSESFLVKRLQELGGIESFPEEFRDSVIAVCSQEVINSVETLVQLPVALWDQSRKEDAITLKKSLDFEVINNDSIVEVRGKITLSLTLVEKIISLAKALPCMENPILADCALEGELVIGSAKISSQQWNLLTAGSFIFLEEPSSIITGKGNFLLKHGKIMPLAFDREQLKSLVLPLAEISPSDFKPAVSSVSATDHNALVMIDCAFSAGTLSLSIEEIINLAGTATLANSMNVSRPLKMLAQGEVVGTGDLIQVGDHYAFFVTQLFHSHDA